MSAIIAIGLMAAAQGGLATPYEGVTQADAVAYEEMQAGEMQAAIAKLEAALADNPGEPAILLNLASAYARVGDFERAAEHYRAAMRSDIRYYVELADGREVDTRKLARQGLAEVEAHMVAMK